jgi:hypothetical protein
MRYYIVQIGTLVVSVILAVTFFILLGTGTPTTTMVSLILLIIAIIGLAILSYLGRIEEELRR